MEQPPQWQHLLAQSHPRCSQAAAPPNMEKQGGTRLTGKGKNDAVNDTNIANKIKHSNYYAFLSPPPCQVEEQATHDSNVTTKKGKGRITFRLPTDHQNSKKIAKRWKRRPKSRHEAQLNCTTLCVEEETTYRWATESLGAIYDNNAQRT